MRCFYDYGDYRQHDLTAEEWMKMITENAAFWRHRAFACLAVLKGIEVGGCGADRGV